MSLETDVPKGKVACLLCRGFISYKNSDRSRFKDHMLNEHDVKYDSDVVLAASVMSQKEKAYIVKCSLQRLSDISDNKVPRSGESLLPQPTAPTQPLIPKQIQGNGAHTPRGRPPGVPAGQRMQVSSPRPGSPHVGRPKQNPVPHTVQQPRIQQAYVV